MKKYKVHTLANDRVYVVKTWYENGEVMKDSFYGENAAKDHADWLTNESPLKNDITLLEVYHVIKSVAAC